jgi:hypothetical protein
MDRESSPTGAAALERIASALEGIGSALDDLSTRGSDHIFAPNTPASSSWAGWRGRTVSIGTFEPPTSPFRRLRPLVMSRGLRYLIVAAATRRARPWLGLVGMALATTAVVLADDAWLSSTWRRLRILEGLGLISRHRTWWQGPRVILATAVGTQLGAVDLPPARVNLPELEHALSVVDLSEELLTAHVGGRWVTERELRRDAIRAHRANGMEPRPGRMRTADGLLVIGDQRIAVELDLTNKRTEVYEQLLRSYAAAAGIDAVWWYGRSAPMRDRLTALARNFQLADFVKVYPWTGGPHGPDLALGT